MVNIPSGQNFLRTQELEINRLDPTETDGTRENVNVTEFMSAIQVTTLDVDPTAGTVAAAFTLPTSAIIIGSTLDILADFVGGTTVEIGDTDVDSLHSETTPSISTVAGAGAGIGGISGGAYAITVTGTYSAGSAKLKVIWFEGKVTA